MGQFGSKVKGYAGGFAGGGDGAHLSITDLKFNPDEKWTNLFREREKNHLYKWVGVSKGEVLDAYHVDDEEGVINFAMEKFQSMLYNDGIETQRIKLTDFLKWKRAADSQMDQNKEKQIDEKELEQKFQEHDAQWRLNKRGIDGETIIHRLLTRNEPECTEVARVLLNQYPGLSQDIYLGDEMFGQTSLHIAISNDDYEMVELLLTLGAKVGARATGLFFAPEDRQVARPTKYTNYVGYAYYGEYPLTFAACFGNKDIYDLLIQHGADPNSQDSLGNTVLHMCVISYSNDMYKYAVRHWKAPANANITNQAGYTPLTLAAKLGRKDIFEEMLELMKVEFFRFSDMAISAYPLTVLDTIRPDGSSNWDSALMTAINGSTSEHLDMIGNEVIQRLLADKWKAFALKGIISRLVLLLCHLSFMSAAIYTRFEDPSKIMSPPAMPPGSTKLWGYWPFYKQIIRYFSEVVMLFTCCYFVVSQSGDEVRQQGLVGFIKNLGKAPSKSVFLFANLCILMCVPCRIMAFMNEVETKKYIEIEETLLLFALPGSWAFLLFFFRSLKLTGPFVHMIYSMIAGDMVRFMIIFGIFLTSFSQAFYFVGKDMLREQQGLRNDVARDGYSRSSCQVRSPDIYTYSNFTETFVTLFRASMGGYDYEEFDCSHFEPMTKIMFAIYMLLMPIMMINMLIAMMGNTYTIVIAQAEKAWRQQWAQIIMVLERSLKKEKLAQHQLEYSIQLTGAEGMLPGAAAADVMETRGLMVIKQTKKTGARQRKQAIENWKRIMHKILNTIDHYGVDKSRQKLHTQNRSGSPLIPVSEERHGNRIAASVLGLTGTDAENAQRLFPAMVAAAAAASASTSYALGMSNSVSRRASFRPTLRDDSAIIPTKRRGETATFPHHPNATLTRSLIFHQGGDDEPAVSPSAAYIGERESETALTRVDSSGPSPSTSGDSSAHPLSGIATETEPSVPPGNSKRRKKKAFTARPNGSSGSGETPAAATFEMMPNIPQGGAASITGPTLYGSPATSRVRIDAFRRKDSIVSKTSSGPN